MSLSWTFRILYSPTESHVNFDQLCTEHTWAKGIQESTKDHVLFQGSWIGNNENYYTMTFRGRVGHKCVGERSKSYVVVYREFVFKIFFSDNQLNLKCMWKHDHVVLILVVQIMTPEARIWQQRRIEIIHICKVSAFVAQVTDVNPEPPFSRFFERTKNC